MIMVVLGALFFIGCASTSSTYDSSSDEMANIDELLGLSESGDESVDEDDVLQMLGIAEEAAMESEFEEFLEDIRLDRKPSAGLGDARAALEVIEKIYEQSS